MWCVKQMSSYLAVMLSGTRFGFGRVESKHPYKPKRGTVQEGPFDSLRSLRVTPNIRFSIAHCAFRALKVTHCTGLGRGSVRRLLK